MKLSIHNPRKNLFKGEVTLVTVPGTEGLFTVLDNHAPIISLLDSGKITIRVAQTGDEKSFDVPDSGYVKVLNNSVTICIN
ncbi:MAG: F0F1 ATP synthase subunit epsilon [Bacteroidales bacterium]|nr:F0F1 ATP synthase subunit epsilon [Bacteroidales bacterium]